MQESNFSPWENCPLEGPDLPFGGFANFKDYIAHLKYIRSCEDL